jgi:hypothetical protein
MERGVPYWHTLVLAVVTGPLGLCSHWVGRCRLTLSNPR